MSGLREAVDSPKVPLGDKPGINNWVERYGALGGKTNWIRRTAEHLKGKGKADSHAIAIAVNAAKRGCASGDTNFKGKQSVNPTSRAEMCAAVKTWEAAKAKAKAARVKEADLTEREAEAASFRLALAEGLLETLGDESAGLRDRDRACASAAMLLAEPVADEADAKSKLIEAAAWDRLLLEPKPRASFTELAEANQESATASVTEGLYGEFKSVLHPRDRVGKFRDVPTLPDLDRAMADARGRSTVWSPGRPNRASIPSVSRTERPKRPPLVAPGQYAPQAPYGDRLAAARRNAQNFGTDPSWYGVESGAMSPGRPQRPVRDASALLDSFLERDDFLGYGYLGNRNSLGERTYTDARGRDREQGPSESVRRRVDKAVVKAANELGWTDEQLFHWTNSKMGRYYAEDSGDFRRGSKADRDYTDALESMRSSVKVFETEMPGTWRDAAANEAGAQSPGRPTAASPGRPSGVSTRDRDWLARWLDNPEGVGPAGGSDAISQLQSGRNLTPAQIADLRRTLPNLEDRAAGAREWNQVNKFRDLLDRMDAEAGAERDLSEFLSGRFDETKHPRAHGKFARKLSGLGVGKRAYLGGGVHAVKRRDGTFEIKLEHADLGKAGESALAADVEHAASLAAHARAKKTLKGAPKRGSRREYARGPWSPASRSDS